MRKLILVYCTLVLFACNPSTSELNPPRKMEVAPDTIPSGLEAINLDRTTLYDKILGSIVGSAIGDAMGAPSEMWSRYNRKVEFGYVDSLTVLTRPPSPEGTWAFGLPIGSTTDDTRWKLITGEFITNNITGFYEPEGPHPTTFANHIITAYQDELRAIKETEGTDPKAFEDNMMRMAWLQEWAQVAYAFTEGDVEEYTYALHKFYGGELVCAGMLYAPALALPYPGHPDQAYRAAYRLSIFDQGYARDITGLTAAMTAAALDGKPTLGKVMDVFRGIDPHGYFRSRLFGRAAFQTYQNAQYIVDQAKTVNQIASSGLEVLPKIDSLEASRMITAYQALDRQNQHSPAHAQEILLISLVAMLYADFDFQKAIEFLTNYGRDNDTTGAVVGAILGAFHGFDALPEQMKWKVLETNREKLGINLELLAKDLMAVMLKEVS